MGTTFELEDVLEYIAAEFKKIGVNIPPAKVTDLYYYISIFDEYGFHLTEDNIKSFAGNSGVNYVLKFLTVVPLTGKSQFRPSKKAEYYTNGEIIEQALNIYE